MYPKFFFERFWEGEQRNELFVCMPFHDAFDSRFNDIIVPAAKEAGFDNAVRMKEDTEGNVVMDKILDGIANSKMILVDLSDDPKSLCNYSQHVNGNVLYEAGIAHAMREPSAIVMIREQDLAKADFDIRGMTINQPKDGKLTREWLSKLLQTSLDNHKWFESKRVRAAAQSIDEISLGLMLDIGRRPYGWNHFNTNNPKVFDSLRKASVLRLLDLGILRFATGGAESPTEYAYHWTSFGYEVMKCLAIKQLTMEEFRKTPQYKLAAEARKQYEEHKKKSADWLE